MKSIFLYESSRQLLTTAKAEPAGGWVPYLTPHAICSHRAYDWPSRLETKRKTDPSPESGLSGRSGKDVPKNKLMNFFAFKSYGFRCVHAHYLTITGRVPLGRLLPARRSKSTDGSEHICLSDACGFEYRRTKVLNFRWMTSIPFITLRDWHNRMIDVIAACRRRFIRSAL